jgi:hypothetical protein
MSLFDRLRSLSARLSQRQAFLLCSTCMPKNSAWLRPGSNSVQSHCLHKVTADESRPKRCMRLIAVQEPYHPSGANKHLAKTYGHCMLHTPNGQDVRRRRRPSATGFVTGPKTDGAGYVHPLASMRMKLVCLESLPAY